MVQQQLTREEDSDEDEYQGLSVEDVNNSLDYYRKLWTEYQEGLQIPDDKKEDLSELLTLLEEGSRESELARIALESSPQLYYGRD